MRIVVALDSFKGSIRAADAVAALAAGWASVRPFDEVVPRPMADGGEGTLAAIAASVDGARRIPVTVGGPDGGPVAASWLLLPDGTGVVELASTSGIELLRGRLLPWDASTRGFGEAIVAALDAGVARLVLAIGSSASTDGGAGVLTALGARLTDAAGEPIRPGARGLADLAAVDLRDLRALPADGAVVLSDVTSPLFGPLGAAAVFGPQKGFGVAELDSVDTLLRRYAASLHADPMAPGAGAAGGTGFALLAWGAILVPGARAIAELVGLPGAIADAGLVVTGEGAYDASSAQGKAPALVTALAAASGVPVALVAGRIAPDADTSTFTAAVELISVAGSSDAALAGPARWLRAAGAALAQGR